MINTVWVFRLNVLICLYLNTLFLSCNHAVIVAKQTASHLYKMFLDFLKFYFHITSLYSKLSTEGNNFNHLLKTDLAWTEL